MVRPGPPEEPHKVTIGIDFGTTKSAVTYVIQREDDTGDSIEYAQIGHISQYPDTNHQDDEVPCALFYDEEGGRSVKMWGHAVTRQLSYPNTTVHRYKAFLVQHMKLLLDESDAAKEIREDLEKQIDMLIGMGSINKKDDILSDYLTELLSHTRKILERRRVVSEVDKYYFAICMPSNWPVESHHRMIVCLELAIRMVWPKFGLHAPIDIFSVREPEALATAVILSNNHVVHVSYYDSCHFCPFL